MSITAQWLLTILGKSGSHDAWPKLVVIWKLFLQWRVDFTATNNQGEHISYTGGPPFGGMIMGSQVTCESCQGTNAHGGALTMHTDIMDAPDIRFQSLRGESDETSIGRDDQDGEHAQVNAGCDLETFHQNVVEGKHPIGEPIDKDMPRRTFENDDLNDLFNS